MTSHSTAAGNRAGTIYIMAMGTSLIVVCLAVAGLQSVRVQRRINESQSQIANAKKLAQAGIEFAQLSMSSDVSWRTKFMHGVPVTRATTGGSFSVVLMDPDDGVISNQTTDPITITSTGAFGASSQKITAYLEPQNTLYAACRSSLYATREINFDNCTVTSNQWAYCGLTFIKIGNPTVNMNCLSTRSNPIDNVSTQRFVVGGVWPMAQPDMVPTSSGYVGRYYIDNSVAISASDLPTGGTELLKNGGFEADTANWTSLGCTLTRDTTQKRTGLASCLVSGRTSVLTTPIQNITEHMLKGRSYTVSVWVRPVEAQDFRITISCYGTGSLLASVSSGNAVSVNAGVWTQVSQSIIPAWSGALTKAEFQIESSKLSSYHLDDASLLNADRVAGTRYIENILLSDTSNPFGNGALSTNGLYSIHVPGENLVIRDSRINATIVVTDSIKTELRSAISWEPIGRNFPALISTETIWDNTTSNSLSESTIGVNLNHSSTPYAGNSDLDANDNYLNPSSTPYAGNSDLDENDNYPTVIAGAILSNRDILLDGVSTLSGPVMSNQTITVKSSSLSINFPSDMILNPPPGFFPDPPPMRLIPSSVQSVP